MSKGSLPRIDLLFLPFRGGDNDGNQGGQGNDDGNGGGNGDGQQTNGQSQNEDDDDDDDDDDDLKGLDDKDRRIVELSREAGKRRREKNAVAKERDRLQRELDALKSGKGDQQQTWESEKADLLQQIATLTDNTSNAVLRNAIQSPESKYSWYDVPVVMGLINREALEIDLEEGVVDGLEAELKRIAKDKPYLVKKGSTSGGSSGSEGGRGNGNGGTGSSGSTGSNPNGRNSSNDVKAARRAQLENQYSGLNF